MYQNFYATKTSTAIGASDTSFAVDLAPSVTSGRLVLEARNPTQKEIISFTGVTGNTLTGVTRGVGGTTAKTHTKGSLVEMNVTAEDLTDALNVPNDIETRFNEVISDHVASGLVWTDDTGLTADMSAGVAYINGKRLSISAVNNRTFTASKDTYVDLGDNGVLDYNEVSNNAATPAIEASHIRLAMVRTNATDTTAVILYSNPSSLVQSNGWQGGLPAVSTVTHNGNRSYDVVFASSVASILSEGMRLEFTKVTAGNAYMGGAFNGSSHYFTKTSPSGTLGTVTNNFTIEAVVQPTSYQDGYMAARFDSTGNNGFGLYMGLDGRIGVYITNGGAANARNIQSYQSIPLNKKTHVAITYTSGTYLVYLDGVSVPVGTATTSGTNPTVAGTGGDFAIGRKGGQNLNYFPGYISNVAVFDAVLSAATIKDHYTKKLTGSETNCIGAWSLDNTANDQSSAGNDLTATGGVGYTAMSPHGQLGNGVETTKAVGLVTNVNGTTVTVQCPEGVTIPSGSSTISSVAYSTVNPFGWVSDKGRWEILTHYLTYTNFTPTVGTVYNPNNMQILKPYGNWLASYRITARAGYSNVAGSYVVVQTFLGTTQASATGRLYPSTIDTGTDAGTGPVVLNSSHTLLPVQMQNTAQATYYLNWTMNTGATPYANQCGFYGTAQTLTLAPAGL